MSGRLDARSAADKAQRALRERLEAAQTRALEEIGRRAVGYARARCPVETGRLRKSIACRVEGASMRLTSDAPYAPCVENGTKGRKAQPFLRPALTEHTREYAQILRRELEQAGR